MRDILELVIGSLGFCVVIALDACKTMSRYVSVEKLPVYKDP